MNPFEHMWDEYGRSGWASYQLHNLNLLEHKNKDGMRCPMTSSFVTCDQCAVRMRSRMTTLRRSRMTTLRRSRMTTLRRRSGTRH